MIVTDTSERQFANKKIIATSFVDFYNNNELRPSAALLESLAIIESENYKKQFLYDITSDQILDRLNYLCNKRKIPLEFIAKLVQLRNSELCFIIDDTASMQTTDANNTNQSRWVAARDRLLFWMDFISLLPIEKVKISFFNSPQVITLSPRDLNFYKEAIEQINQSFNNISPSGMTNLYNSLRNEFKNKHENTFYYVLTDGELCGNPVSLEIEYVLELCHHIPVTLINMAKESDFNSWLSNSRLAFANYRQNDYPFSIDAWVLTQLIAIKDKQLTELQSAINEKYDISEDSEHISDRSSSHCLTGIQLDNPNLLFQQSAKTKISPRIMSSLSMDQSNIQIGFLSKEITNNYFNQELDELLKKFHYRTYEVPLGQTGTLIFVILPADEIKKETESYKALHNYFKSVADADEVEALAEYENRFKSASKENLTLR